MNDFLNHSINDELTTNKDYRRFIFIGTFIGSLFLMFFAFIDGFFLSLYLDSVAEAIASIILFIIHKKEAKRPIESNMIIFGIFTVSIVLMIGVFSNNAADGAIIWFAIAPFICFLFLNEKLAFICSSLLSFLFIAGLFYFYIMHPEKGFNLLTIITTTGALACSAVLAWAFADNRSKLIASLSKQAKTDTLTSLFNRRGLMLYFEQFIHQYKKNRQTFSMLILDLDNFKRINDNFGHDIGDEFIIACASLIKTALTKGAIAARLGGEEYVVLLPNKNLKEAEKIAYKIKNSIENLTIKTLDNTPTNITVSIGLTSISHDSQSFQTLYKTADEALYKAKKEGRNRIFVN